MESPNNFGLPPEIQSQISTAFEANDYITIVGKEVNTNGAVGFLVNKAKDGGKKIVQVDIPKPKVSFINNFDDKKALDLFKKSFDEAGLQLTGVEDIHSSVSGSLSKTLKRGIDPTLVVLTNIQNLPNSYGEDLILSIRSMYNMRAKTEGARNIQFVLVGEKDPDEIRDIKSPRTPYNIGTRVRL